MQIQKVFIVETGTFFDGSSVVGVFTDEELAKRAVGEKTSADWKPSKDEIYTEYVSPDGLDFVRLSAKEVR